MFACENAALNLKRMLHVTNFYCVKFIPRSENSTKWKNKPGFHMIARIASGTRIFSTVALSSGSQALQGL